MFNPRSKSRKLWVGPEILGYYKVGECGSGTPLVEHFSLDLNIWWPIFGRTQPCAEYRNFATAENCRPCCAAARHAACAWSRWCRARPNVETLQSCKRHGEHGVWQTRQNRRNRDFAAAARGLLCLTATHRAATALSRGRIGHEWTLAPWTSTGGPNHACMMVAVRVADFGCGGAAPPWRRRSRPSYGSRSGKIWGFDWSRGHFHEKTSTTILQSHPPN